MSSTAPRPRPPKPITPMRVSHRMLCGSCGSHCIQLGADTRRAAVRHRSALSAHDPPRTTCDHFSAVGTVTGRRLSLFAARRSYAFRSYWSRVHSHTLPYMSHRPNGLGLRVPPLCVVPFGWSSSGEFALNHAYSSSSFGSSPKKYGRSPLPPRARYSHSASVGSRYALPVFLRRNWQNTIAEWWV